MAHSIYVDKRVGGRYNCMCDPSLTRANPSALEMSVAHTIKRSTDVLFTYLEKASGPPSVVEAHSTLEYQEGEKT